MNAFCLLEMTEIILKKYNNLNFFDWCIRGLSYNNQIKKVDSLNDFGLNTLEKAKIKTKEVDEHLGSMMTKLGFTEKDKKLVVDAALNVANQITEK